MADVNLLYKSDANRLKAEDLGNAMPVFTIATATVKEFSPTERKIVLTFFEDPRDMVVNKTNAESIAGLYGPDSDQWIGKQIMLFSVPTTYQGQPTHGIRVRAPQAPAPHQLGGVQAPDQNVMPQQNVVQTGQPFQPPLPAGTTVVAGGGGGGGTWDNNVPLPNSPDDYGVKG